MCDKPLRDKPDREQAVLQARKKRGECSGWNSMAILTHARALTGPRISNVATVPVRVVAISDAYSVPNGLFSAAARGRTSVMYYHVASRHSGAGSGPRRRHTGDRPGRMRRFWIAASSVRARSDICPDRDRSASATPGPATPTLNMKELLALLQAATEVALRTQVALTGIPTPGAWATAALYGPHACPKPGARWLRPSQRSPAAVRHVLGRLVRGASGRRADGERGLWPVIYIKVS